MTKGNCVECRTKPTKGSSVNAQFCSAACRRTFHNRRMTRGALVYDVMMSRIENAGAVADDRLPDLKVLDELMRKWHKEDAARGAKRTTVPLFEIRYAIGDALRL